MYDIFNDITDFIFIEDEPAPSDVIIIPGSPYAGPAEYAAQLWWGKYAPVVLPTGKYYDILIYNRRLSTKEKENYELDEIRGEINGRRRYDHHAQE